VNDDAVGVAAQRTTSSVEGHRLRWCKFEADRDEMSARAFLEIVPAIENLPRPGCEDRLYPPVELNAPQAFVPDNRCAQIRARQFRRRRGGAFDRIVDGAIDGFKREAGAVEVQHGGTPVKGQSRR
jgi:hypothetical protein